jgi:CRP/FNR family cyclic AMP-dependent transcriptional regulator
MDARVMAHLLRQTAVFDALPASLLDELVALTVTRRVAAGEHVFRQGDPPDALYVVSTGELRAYSLGPGPTAETVHALLGPGALFGELALLDGNPRSASVLAVRDSVLLRLPRARLLALLTARPELALAMIGALVTRVRELSVRVEERGVHDGRTRLARLLLQAADTQASGDEDHVELRQHVPQAVLGATLGLSRQTVNRLLQELQSEALVEIGRARLTVRSRAGLRRIAHPPREAD